jgi:hypothetical protein
VKCAFHLHDIIDETMTNRPHLAKSLGTGRKSVRLRIATARQVSEGGVLMGNSQGRDNVRKRAARRKKTERLALAKKKTAKKPKK